MNELFVTENIEGLDVLGARCLILNIFFGAILELLTEEGN